MAAFLAQIILGPLAGAHSHPDGHHGGSVHGWQPHVHLTTGGGGHVRERRDPEAIVQFEGRSAGAGLHMQAPDHEDGVIIDVAMEQGLPSPRLVDSLRPPPHPALCLHGGPLDNARLLGGSIARKLLLASSTWSLVSPAAPTPLRI